MKDSNILFEFSSFNTIEWFPFLNSFSLVMFKLSCVKQNVSLTLKGCVPKKFKILQAKAKPSKSNKVFCLSKVYGAR